MYVMRLGIRGIWLYDTGIHSDCIVCYYTCGKQRKGCWETA